MNMTRRSFLQGAACSTLLGAGGCKTFGRNTLAVEGVRIGVQMWSVNDIWKKNPADAFRQLKALGYDGVQSLGFYTMDWDELERMLDGEGLQIVDMPFYEKMLHPDEGKFLEFCARFGIDFAYEPWTKHANAVAWRQHARWLKDIERRFAKANIRVGYHNHQHEHTERFDGKTAMEILAEERLAFELDVGHVKLGGDDPIAWFKRLPLRIPSIHAKPSGGNAIGNPQDTIDWAALFQAAKACGTKWAIVECEARRNTYEDVADSARYLANLRT